MTHLELSPRARRAWLTAIAAFVAALLLIGLNAFGAWDPAELQRADLARRLLEGEADVQSRPRFGAWLTAIGFWFLGAHEWAGRLPLAVAGLVTVLLAYALVRGFIGTRAGLYTALITGTTPLFVLNARSMLGEAPAFASQTALALALTRLARPSVNPTREAWKLACIWSALAAGAALLCIGTSGVLLGVLPPLGAALIASALDQRLPRPDHGRPPAAIVYGLALATLPVALGVAMAVARDQDGYSAWLGGRPGLSDPRSFDLVLESVFHTFAPWSSLLPAALGAMLLMQGDNLNEHERGPPADERHFFQRFVVSWAALGYGAQMLYTARYGTATFLPVVALAAAVAGLLDALEASRVPLRAGAIACLLLCGLLARDLALYPDVLLSALAVGDVPVPSAFNPKTAWAAALAAFALAAALGLGVRQAGRYLALAAPYRLVQGQWNRGPQFKAWLCGAGAVVLGLAALGAIAFTMPDTVGLSTLGAKWSRRGLMLLLALPVAVALAQLVLFLFHKLGSRRLWPMLLAGSVLGAYTAHGFIPALSAHLSPRRLYATYRELAGPDEKLGGYRAGRRRGSVYQEGLEIEALGSIREVVDFLHNRQRRWVALPAEELANVDHGYRKKAGSHLFAVNAGSARTLLTANYVPAGQTDHNPLTKYVLKTVPNVQYRLRAKFGSQIELAGYSLALPHGEYVGAGETFTITWVYRVLGRVPGNHKVFVHIDGFGLRLNGDHVPVGEKYPVRLWESGDVIVDVQKLAVPANFRAGSYTIYVGFWAGSKRLPVTRGPNDGTERLRAGVLIVR
ncbi:MAG: glycosyltransferase family 39 protein [Proteobacteria bacterium]|nr:glycosyltransferase family 39 protein [Pseudomonadota bacterium]